MLSLRARALPRPPYKVSAWCSVYVLLSLNRLGQISASLTSLSRTIDDYAETAKKELVAAKQEKAHERIKNFRGELADYRQTLERVKRDREDSVWFPAWLFWAAFRGFSANLSSLMVLLNTANISKSHRAPRTPPTSHANPREPILSV